MRSDATVSCHYNSQALFFFSPQDKTGSRQDRPGQRDCSRVFDDAPDLHDAALEEAPHAAHLLEVEPPRHPRTDRSFGLGTDRTHSPKPEAGQLDEKTKPLIRSNINFWKNKHYFVPSLCLVGFCYETEANKMVTNMMASLEELKKCSCG